jgi:hypothetical protein
VFDGTCPSLASVVTYPSLPPPPAAMTDHQDRSQQQAGAAHHLFTLKKNWATVAEPVAWKIFGKHTY